MDEISSVVRLRQPDEIDDPLTDVLRAGARRLTGIGAVSVARPKVQDRGSGEAEHLGGVGIVRLSSAAMVSGH